jgi:pantoate--beta-alanine ligase
MKVVRTAAELRTELHSRGGARVGFVPTMGALHAGHLSLVKAARSDCDMVVLSIFVNPLQFGPREDFSAYPRDEGRDLKLAEGEGVDIVFAPATDEMYPPGRSTVLTVGALGEVLEGADRPGHFDGVATVVATLFNIVRPDAAYFGQKDAQQVAVIKQLIRDLAFGIDLVVCQIVREPDGLAMSSRNAYLAPEQRTQATALHRALVLGAEVIGSEGPEGAEKRMWELLLGEGVQPSYTRAVDPDSFGPPQDGMDVLLVIAAKVGATRLIDNMLVSREG